MLYRGDNEADAWRAKYLTVRTERDEARIARDQWADATDDAQQGKAKAEHERDHAEIQCLDAEQALDATINDRALLRTEHLAVLKDLTQERTDHVAALKALEKIDATIAQLTVQNDRYRAALARIEAGERDPTNIALEALAGDASP